MRNRERDALRELDWSKVYADVPAEVETGVRTAHLRIRERERRRRRSIRMAACAACAMLAVGAAAAGMRMASRAPDRVAPPVPEVIRLDAGSEVYASRDDACYHLLADCPQASGESVALRLVTALEFEKAPCPACAANVLADAP